MYLHVILIIFLVVVTTDADAQFWKKKKKVTTENTVQAPNSRDPAWDGNDYKKRDYTPAAARKSTKGPTYGLEQEFYERMEALAKERKKQARMMEKPQYSNPMYFGHKHKPKKRKPSKMKFCKECGIRH